MRKFSKILTVLLTVCLLCGVFVSVLASAEEAAWTIKVTSDSKNRYTDLDENTTTYWNHYRPNFAYGEKVVGEDGNNYYRASFPQTVLTDSQYAADALYKQNSNVQLGYMLVPGHADPAASVSGYDYVVFDFDYGTDKYVHTYTEDVTYTDSTGKEVTSAVTKYEYVDAIPEGISDTEKANYNLAYNTNFYVYLRYYDANNKNVSSNSGATFVNIGAKDGVYYASKDTTYGSANDIPLSNEIGVFDHFTYVFKVKYNESGATTGVDIYVYMNGEFLWKETQNTTNDIRLEKLTLTYYYNMGDCVKYYPNLYKEHAKEFGSKASVCLDNLALNWYKESDSKEQVASLDAFYANNHESTPIYECEDIVYTPDYESPNPSRTATVNGIEYGIINKAFRALPSGGTITISENLNNYKLPKFYSKFCVVAKDGAKFSLDPVTKASYDVTEKVVGDTTTYLIQTIAAPTTDSWLDVTGDYHNHANAYATTGGGANNGNRSPATNKWNGVKTGFAQIEDGDYFKGVGTGIVNGVFSVHRNPSAAVSTNANYAKRDAMMFWYMSPYRPTTAGWKDGDITNYDYVIADFDFGTNRYAYTTADGVTATGTTVPEGATNVKPAYSAGMMVGVSYVGFTGEPTVNADGIITAASTEGRYGSKFWVQVIYNAADGNYYASADSTYDSSDVPLSGQVGEFDHATFVFDPANRKIVAFINGQYVNEINYSENWIVTNFAATAILVPGTGLKLNDQVSMAVDNNAVNWYRDAANTSTGIDAFMKGDYKNGKLYNCDDVLYNKDYYIPHASSITVGDERVYMSGVVVDKIAALENNGKVISHLDIIGICPTADVIYVQLTGNAKKVTLSHEADRYIIEDQGEGLYKVRKLAVEELVSVTVLDRLGNTLDTFYLAPNKELLAPEFDLNEFVVETRKVYTHTGWYIKDGDTEISAPGYSYSDITKVSKTLTVYPKITEETLPATFAAYTVAEDGMKKLVGAASDYATMANLVSKIQNAKSGTTIVLLYDINTPYDINSAGKAQVTVVIPEGRTVSLDLNGRTLVHSYGGTSAYGGQMFKVPNNATFNLYSSAEGGIIYQARPHTGRDNSSYGQVCASGILCTENTTAATINVDGAVDPAYKNNLSVYGGTLYYSSGSQRTAKNVVNVGGGFYYAPTRSAASIFTTQNSGGNYYNLTDATFYSANPSAYGVFHDYAGSSYPKAGSHIVANGCTFVAYNTSKKAAGNLFYGSDATSTAKFTDCILIGSIGGSIQIEVGEGCIVAGSSLGSRAKLAADVKVVKNVGYSFAMPDHPNIPFYDVVEINKDGTTNTNYSAENDPLLKDENGKFYLNPKIYDKNNWVNDGTFIFTDCYVTYANDEAAPEFDTVIGQDNNGNTLVANKWVKGSLAYAAPSASFNMGMYKVTNAKWEATDDKFVYTLADYGVTGNFKDMLVNASLSTGMTYNIYIPADAGITVTSVEGGKLSDKRLSYNGRTYYIVSVELAAAEFNAKDVTVNFSVESILGGAAENGKQTLKADIVGYATKVSENYKCGTEEAALIVNMMEYKYAVAMAVYAYAGGNPDEFTAPDAVEAFLAEHAGCGCDDAEIIDPEVEANLDELIKAGLEGATFTMSEIGVISLVFESENKELDVWVSYNITEETKLTVKAEYNEEAKCYITPGISAAYIDNLFTITVGKATGTYSLANFIAEAGDAITEFVAISLAEYAAAAEAYKFVLNEEVKK